MAVREACLKDLPPAGYLDRGIKNILEKKLNGEPVAELPDRSSRYVAGVV